MIQSFPALKECHLTICPPLLGNLRLPELYTRMYFCRLRAVCWKNARFSIIPSGTDKQVSGCGIVEFKKYKDKR